MQTIWREPTRSSTRPLPLAFLRSRIVFADCFLRGCRRDIRKRSTLEKADESHYSLSSLNFTGTLPSRRFELSRSLYSVLNSLPLSQRLHLFIPPSRPSPLPRPLQIPPSPLPVHRSGLVTSTRVLGVGIERCSAGGGCGGAGSMGADLGNASGLQQAERGEFERAEAGSKGAGRARGL